MAVKKDSGWAWVVCLGAFAAMLLETGTVKALGVLLPILRQQFSTHTWVIGLSIALMPGFGTFTCPIAGALSKSISPRWTVMTFSVLASVGLIAGFFVHSVNMLAISFILSGFALGAEVVVLGELASYFDKYYGIANAFTQTGLSVGVIIMPLLAQFFIDVYGWRGTMMMLGGLSLHLTVCGAVLIPITSRRFIKQDHVDDNVIKKSIDSKSDTDEPMRQSNTITLNIIHNLDLILFNNVNFIPMLLYNFGNGYCLTGWLIYLVPHAIDAGFPPYKASSLATLGGVGNLLGNMIYPMLKIKLSDKQILYFTSVFNFLALAIDPIVIAFSSYIGLLLSSFVFGFGRGMAIVSVYRIVKDTVEEDKMTNAVMWINVTYSVGSMLSGFLSGWMFDQTGNYITSFLILSAVCLLSVFPQFIVDIKNRMKYTQHNTVSSADHDNIEHN